MLMIKAEGSAGCNLRTQMLPEMLDLAKKLDCSVEVKANGTRFWVYPGDTVEELQQAYDRLYPESRIVSVGMGKPWPKDDDQ